MDRDGMDKLDGVLRTRRVAEMQDGLEQRIIAAAARAPRSVEAAVERKGLISLLVEFWDDAFVIPRPAISFAVVMIIGGGVGLYSADMQRLSSDTNEVMEMYVLMNDDTQLGAEL